MPGGRKLYKGTTRTGYNSITKNQIKKHFLQMTKSEKELLQILLSNIDVENLQYSYHLLLKLNTTYAKSIIISLLSSENILDNVIELNINKNDYGNVSDIRVLLRDKNLYRVKMLDYNTNIESIENANLCVVYSITNNRIVTAYWNNVNDDHKTINWKRYNQYINILEYKGLLAGE